MRGRGCAPGRSVFHYESRLSELQARSHRKQSVHSAQNFAYFPSPLCNCSAMLTLIHFDHLSQREHNADEAGRIQNPIAIGLKKPTVTLKLYLKYLL